MVHMGASEGFFVRANRFPFTAFLKPTKRFPPHTPWPAVEKIAADLAIDLELPVPPVQLYDRPNGDEKNLRIGRCSSPLRRPSWTR